jgi:predicted ATPase/DNA-binding SARP family transcriptional activator/DNA-binding CsgD family transcriptional regulator
VRVWLLGGLQVSVGPRTIDRSAWRLRKATSLVKLLALAPRHRLHREQIMDLLWPDLEPAAAANNLRYTLHSARRVLDPIPVSATSYLNLQDNRLALCPNGPLWVDVEAFEAAAAAARRARDPAAYRAAIELYAGDLLPEDFYEGWTEERREELRQTRIRLLVELAGLHEERGEHEPAVEVLRKALVEEPTSEEAHAGLMRLYALSDRRGQALAQYERLREALSKELGAESSAATRLLRDEIAAGRFPSTPPAGLSMEELPDAGKHNLPTPRTSFVGRERELIEVKRALAMTRLLTLTGAGGSGKTRLALKVAGDLVGVYPDGLWLVELAALLEPGLLPQEVAKALGVRELPGRPLTDTLVDALRDKEVLVVMDNCEHLVDTCACLVDALLASCPRLRVLATSREPLGVEGEALWRVPSLSVPDTDRLPAAGELTRYDAARLFLDRVRLRLPDFDLTPENAHAVAEVCGRLEGIPLAIELATARVGALAVKEVAARLEDSLGFLSAGLRTAAPRQRTMRATLEWSHRLLSEPERVLFGRLSVFAGGWTLEAAEGVGSDGIGKTDILHLLSRLVDKSLVVAETTGDGRGRYRMLEPVRQYAREKLEESGESDAVRHRHTAFFLSLAEEAEPELRRPQQEEWLKRLEREHDNVRSALSWALERGEAELGLRLVGALGEFWYTRGHLDEGQRWLQAALANNGSLLVPRRVKALAWAGYIAWEQGDYEWSTALGEESLVLSRNLGDQSGVAAALHGLGTVALHRNECEKASAALEEALALRLALGDTMGVGRVLQALGLVAVAHHDYRQAIALHEEGLPLAREMGDKLGLVLLLGQGALAYLGLGDYQQARVLCAEGLELSRQLRHRHTLVYILHIAAVLTISQGDPLRSARLWEAAEALRRAIGATLSAVSRYVYGPYIVTARARVSEAAWEAASAEGRAMTPEQAVEYALSEEEPAPPAAPTVPEEPSAGTVASKLARREREVAGLVACGLTNRQIASELSISEHTVANHVAKILRKLGLGSRSQITAWVVEQRWLT